MSTLERRGSELVAQRGPLSNHLRIGRINLLLTIIS